MREMDVMCVRVQPDMQTANVKKRKDPPASYVSQTHCVTIPLLLSVPVTMYFLPFLLVYIFVWSGPSG